VTLTGAAAAEVSRRWGVEATVLPHPHAVDFGRMRQERPRWRRGQFLVGAHLANLRSPVDPVRLVEGLAEGVAGIGDARLVVHVHETVLDSGSATYDLAAVRRIDAVVREVGGAVKVHRPMTDSQLWDHLFSLDVSVVPGLYGSHSVWPEACHDLGTTALLPAGTHAAAQRDCLTYEVDDHGSPDPGSLAVAVKTAREQGSVWRADPGERWKERVAVAESLRGIYERLCGLGR
jgi:beta-1,4-mannosyltransferase